MGCEFIKTPDGATVIMCSRGRKSTPCHYCGKPSIALCDYPTESGKTCDKPICNSCRVKIGPDVDYCWKHEGGRL